jgi:hypothetical protein
VQYLTNMSPAPVVAIVDACGVAVARSVGITVTDSGSKLAAPIATTTNSSGVATLSTVNFPTYGYDDTLIATADAGSNVGGCDSEPGCESTGFHVYQLMQPCPANRTCTGAVGDGTTTASFNVASGTAKDTLVADTLADEPTNATCMSTSGRSQDYGSTVSFDITSRGKVVTMTLLKKYVLEISNNGTPFMDICLSVPSSAPGFTDKYGNPNVHDGLLQDCSAAVPVNDPPCINTRKKNAGNEIITFTLDPGDPKSSWF